MAQAISFVHSHRECLETFHATGFSQWLMTNLLSAEFIRRKILEGASPDAPNFSAVREHCPPENHSLFATRHSLPFWLKSVATKTKPAIWVARCGLRVEG